LHLAAHSLVNIAVQTISKRRAIIPALQQEQIEGLRPTGIEAVRWMLSEGRDIMNPLEIHCCVMVAVLLPTIRILPPDEITIVDLDETKN
jgi:hypothetical protein